jgi:hypothetical protein
MYTYMVHEYGLPRIKVDIRCFWSHLSHTHLEGLTSPPAPGELALSEARSDPECTAVPHSNSTAYICINARRMSVRNGVMTPIGSK